jgi:hypothetical protein
MALFQRKPELPADLAMAWRAFLDCAQAVEGGRRILLGTLPAGRVEPAPVAVGADAVVAAIHDARGWMDGWKVDELVAEWEDCHAALDEAEVAVTDLLDVAASTSELEELLEAVGEVVAPLDAFADAERGWHRHWRISRTPA